MERKSGNGGVYGKGMGREWVLCGEGGREGVGGIGRGDRKRKE